MNCAQSSILTLTLVAVLVLSSGAKADYYVSLNAGSAPNGPTDASNLNLGTVFTVGSSDITVTALGTYGGSYQPNKDSQGVPTGTYDYYSTLPVDTTAYLYSATADATAASGYDYTLITSVEISAGTNALQASNVSNIGFAFADLATPVTLTAGDTYLVSSDVHFAFGDYTAEGNTDGYVANGYIRYSTGSLTLGTGIAAGSASVGAFNSDGSTPVNNAFGNVLGGNFIFHLGDAPEPSTYALMAIGLGLLGVVAWKRRLASI